MLITTFSIAFIVNYISCINTFKLSTMYFKITSSNICCFNSIQRRKSF